MKTWMMALLLAIAGSSMGQHLTYPIRKSYDFNWNALEKKVPKTVVDAFIKSLPNEFELFRNKENAPYHTLDSLPRYLHFVDVNADGKEDVFYNGPTLGEGTLVQLYVSTAKGYKKVLSEIQGIAKIDWVAHRIKRLYITNWGCCAEYREINRVFEFTYDLQGVPTSKQIYQAVTCYLGIASRPDSLLAKPVRFEVLNDNYKMRYAPRIDDTTENIWTMDDEKHPRYGNEIGLLKKGARGTALGKKTDATGREWWYVEIDATWQPDKPVFYVRDLGSVKVIGWVSSRFVKVLE